MLQYFLNFQQLKKWNMTKKQEWFRKTVLTVSFITMGCIAYWVNPVNNLLSTILVCSLSSLISSMFYMIGINRGLRMTKETRDAIVQERRVQMTKVVERTEDKDRMAMVASKIPKKEIDTEKNTNRV